MPRIHKNIDLNSDGKGLDVWETSAASSFDVTVYTGNWGAAYSEDGGETYRQMDPWKLCTDSGEAFCCDQVVIFIPQINSFAWLIQSNAGNYVLALATPAEIVASQGRNWTVWVIPAARFGGAGAQADLPQVVIGDAFLFLTFNLVSKYSIGLRLSLSELFHRQSIFLTYFAATSNYWMKPVQNTGSDGFFVAQNSNSELRVFKWSSNSGTIDYFDVKIASIPTEGFPVANPDGGEWLGTNSKVDWQIQAATRAGADVWIAWNGARKVSGQSSNAFNFPHIGMAVINVVTKQLVSQPYIWNPDHAFVWPSLATNVHGDVGLSFCWGGGKTFFPQHGVALLTGSNAGFLSTSSGTTSGAGGHYTSIRMAFPNVNEFCASGFNQVKTGNSLVNHPHYVVFGE